VRFKGLRSPEEELRDQYGDARKKEWVGHGAGNTWMGGDIYSTTINGINRYFGLSLKTLKRVKTRR
jgi:hypothetical protein